MDCPNSGVTMSNPKRGADETGLTRRSVLEGPAVKPEPGLQSLTWSPPGLVRA